MFYSYTRDRARGGPRGGVGSRAVLEVDGPRSPDSLVAALVRSAPPNLSVVPLGIDEEGVHLRARFLGGPAANDPGSWRDDRGFDTPEANRY